MSFQSWRFERWPFVRANDKWLTLAETSVEGTLYDVKFTLSLEVDYTKSSVESNLWACYKTKTKEPLSWLASLIQNYVDTNP